MALIPREHTRSTLIYGVLFFTKRSLGYTYIGRVNRKTKATQACDITFRSGARVVPQKDPKLYRAETVEMDFWKRKSGIKGEKVP